MSLIPPPKGEGGSERSEEPGGGVQEPPPRGGGGGPRPPPPPAAPPPPLADPPPLRGGGMKERAINETNQNLGSRRRRPRRTPKGRQVDPTALDEVCALLGDRERRRDLLIEHLHLIQDRYGCLSAAHLAALAQEMRLALTEVYEVATCHRRPSPCGCAIRSRARSLALSGCSRICRDNSGRTCASCARPAWAPATARRYARSATRK
jgi:hypothetical protein